MNALEIFEALKAQFADVALDFQKGSLPGPAKDEPGHAGDSFIAVPANKIADVCKWLRDDAAMAFDCLSDETAVDRKDSFEVVYHLFSYVHKHSIALKVILSHDGTPKLPTIEHIWPVANWLEREIYDLMGIVFEGHSDLRRIMMPDDWAGHPLRKDYKEAEEYHGISTTRTSLLQ